MGMANRDHLIAASPNEQLSLSWRSSEQRSQAHSSAAKEPRKAGEAAAALLASLGPALEKHNRILRP